MTDRSFRSGPMPFAGLDIVFDLDGTIVDTAPDLIRVLNEVIVGDGLKEEDLPSARTHIGYGAMALILRAYKRQNRALSEDKAKDLHQEFLARYRADIARLSMPFPGTEQTLNQLRRGGARLSVCTNKPGDMARDLLPKLGLADYFTRIVGSGDGIPCKPNPEHIYEAAGHRRRRSIVMVGDGAPDAQAARAAGCACILMAYGYSPRPLATMGASAILRSMRELPAAIEALV